MSKTNSSDIDVHIGSSLRSARLKAGKTLQELASVLSVSFQQIQHYEKGEARIPSSSLYVLARHLDLDITYFFEGVDEKSYKTLKKDLALTSVSDSELVCLIKDFSKISDSEARKKMSALVEAIANKSS